MAANDLKVNDKIDIEVERGSYKGNYDSKVADIKEDYIAVLPPYVNGELVALRRNLNINIYYTGETAAFVFKSKIINRIKDPIPMLIVTKADEINRIQRREFFRIDVKLGVKYRRVDKNKKVISEDYKETSAIDISGGGIKIIFNIVDKENIPADTLLEMRINIDEIKDIPVYGVVVTKYDLPDGIAAGVKFIDLSRCLRDNIVSWIFDYQRELRKKGLL